MFIRKERASDFNEVYDLLKNTFEQAEMSDGNEQDLVVALRKSDAFVPELSLVAVDKDEIVGYILFTEAKVDGETVLVLAPVAVLPQYQQQGIGGELIKAGHQIAQDLGYEYIFVLGHETYYPRFGYIPAEKFGVVVPNGIPSENFMAVSLQENAKPLAGSLQYPKEFGI